MPDRYRVTYSSTATTDLEEIFDYIKQTSPQNAVEMITRLVEAIDSLDVLPHRFAPTRSRRGFRRGVRAMPVRPFLVH